MSTWREEAAKIIAEVVEGLVGKHPHLPYTMEDAKDIRRRLSEAYPFGVKKGYPYKVWCEEVKKVVRVQNE